MRRALLNALFVLGVVGLSVFGAIAITRRQWRWQETFTARAEFRTVAGLEVGARVLFQGLDAGQVAAILPPARPGGPVAVSMRLDARLKDLVRSDAIARIGSQGIVGAKVLELVPGRPDAPPLASGQALRTEAPRELTDLMDDATRSLRRLDAVALAAESGLAEINGIARSINGGEGTLGRLVKDEEAYNRLLALSEHGEATLIDLEENLSAMKQIWPIRNYFSRRGFEDLDRVLYQPDAERESRIFPESDLFEPGRAVLTQHGREKLDAFATWFKGLKRPATTEIVVAAFTESSATTGDEEMAQILTQKQADAVRAYLIGQHRLDNNGLFASRRKIAAAGFGTQTPKVPGNEPSAEPRPPRRVELILFTPQT